MKTKSILLAWLVRCACLGAGRDNTQRQRRLPGRARRRLAPLCLVIPLAVLAAIAPAATPVPNILLHALFNPSTNVSGTYAVSVAVDANIAVVGEPASAAVLVYSAVSGALLHTLNTPDPAKSDGFGASVAISGTRLLVGADGDPFGATYAGSAYVYDLASPTPTVPVATLNNPNPAADDHFGNSVAISGMRVVVGAFGDDTGATDSGSAYVYDLASATPLIPITLVNPNPAASNWFGWSVAISGTRVVIGAYLNDTGADAAGIAYVYDVASAIPWVPVATLTNPSPVALDYFGITVAVDGTTVVAGAPNNDTNGRDRGAAYVFGPLSPALRIVRAAPGFATISWTPSNSPSFVGSSGKRVGDFERQSSI